MKKFIASLVAVMCLCMFSFSFAGQKVVEFTWDMATVDSDLAGFSIYLGNSPMTQISDAVWTFDVPYVAGDTVFVHEEDLTCADDAICTFYFRIDAYDTAQNRTAWATDEPTVTIDFQPPTSTPTNFKAIIKVVPAP